MGTKLREKVNSIADLRTLENVPVGKVVEVDSYYGDGNGGGGAFVKVADTGQVDNGGSICRSADGVYERVVEPILDVKVFGVNETDLDSQVRINKAIEYASTTIGISKLIARGVIKINDTINLDFGLTWSSNLPVYGSNNGFDVDLCWGTGSRILYDGIGTAVSINDTVNTEIKVKVEKSSRWDVADELTSIGIHQATTERARSSDFYFEASGFHDGIKISAGSLGIQENRYYLGTIRDNRYGFHTKKSGAGWWNQNIVIGGLIKALSVPQRAETIVGVYLEDVDNLNTFYGVNIEKGYTNEALRIVKGDSNSFIGCRFEGHGADSIIFESDAIYNRIQNSKYDVKPMVLDNSNGKNFVDSTRTVTAGSGSLTEPSFLSKKSGSSTDYLAFGVESYFYDDELTWYIDQQGKMAFYDKNSAYSKTHPSLLYEPYLGLFKTGNGNSAPTSLFKFSDSTIQKPLYESVGQVQLKYVAIDSSITGTELQETSGGAYFVYNGSPTSTIDSISSDWDDGKHITIAVRSLGGSKLTISNGTTLKTVNGLDYLLKDYDVVRFEVHNGIATMMNVPRSASVVSITGGEPVGSSRVENIVFLTQAQYDQGVIDGLINSTTQYNII